MRASTCPRRKRRNGRRSRRPRRRMPQDTVWYAMLTSPLLLRRRARPGRVPLEHPNRAVAALDEGATFGGVEARPYHVGALAAELGERPADAVACRGHPPRPHLSVHVLRGTRPVDLGVLRFEEARVARVPLDLGVSVSR